MSPRSLAGGRTPSAPLRGIEWFSHRLALFAMLGGAFCCSLDWTVPGTSLPMADGFIMLAFVCQLPWVFAGFTRIGSVPFAPILSALLFLLSATISLARGDYYAEPVTAATLVYAMIVFPLLLMLIVGEDLRHLDAILAAWVAGALLTAMVAVSNRLGVPLFGLVDPGLASGLGRAYGLSYHPNELAYTSALCIPVVMYLALRYPGLLSRAIALGAIPLLLWGLHLSGSRSAFWALVMALAAPLAARLQVRWLAIYGLVFIGLLALALLVAAAVSEFGLPVFQGFEESALGRILGLSESKAGSDAGRLVFVQFGWEQFLSSPFFGNGYGWLRASHMHVLAILQTGGLLGLTAFLLWVSAVVLAALRVGTRIHELPQPRAPMLWLAILSGLTVWVINGALQPILTDRNGYVLIGALFLLDALLRRASAGSGSHPAALPPKSAASIGRAR